MLDRQESKLFAITGKISVPPAKEVEVAEPQKKLDEETMVKILENWNDSRGYVRPQEPVEGQLSMEQTLEAAEAGLSYFEDRGIIPEDLIKDGFTSISAALYENQSNEEISEKLPPEYSYWTINFRDQRASGRLTLNAVTGEIWSADIHIPRENVPFSQLDAKAMLDIYIDYLGLSGGDSLKFDENYASKSFGGSNFIVLLRKNEGSQRNPDESISISIHSNSTFRKQFSISQL